MAKVLVDGGGVVKFGVAASETACTQARNTSLSMTVATLEEQAAEDPNPEVLAATASYEVTLDRYLNTADVTGVHAWGMAATGSLIYTDSDGNILFTGAAIVTGRTASDPARQAATQTITFRSTGTPTVAPPITVS